MLAGSGNRRNLMPETPKEFLMFFEERELRPYAEPVTPDELQPSSVYFSVSYAPESMIIPFMETLRFVGRNLSVGDKGVAYFEDVKDADPFGREEDQLKATFEFEKALNGLLWCSLRRRGLDAQRSMYFQGRKLSPDPEPVSANELKEGSVYFALNYADEARLIPVMDTLVFTGKDIDVRSEGKLYFQDFYSYHKGVGYDSPDKPNWAAFAVKSVSELNNVFEFEQALEELMRCSLRRRNV